MVLGLVLCFAVLAVVMYGLFLAGELIYLVDPASIFIVLGGMLALLLGTYSLRDIGGAIGFLWSRETTVPRRKAAKLSQLYSAAGDYSLYCGLLGTYIGFVLILQTASDPDTLHLKFAVCSVTCFYGFILYALALLAGRKLALCTLTDTDYPIKPRRQTLSMFVGTLFFLVIMILGIQAGGGSPISFIDPPSLVLIVGGSILGLLWLVPAGDFKDTCQLLMGREVISEEQATKDIGVFAQFNDLVVSLMLIGVGAGAIALIQRIDDPSKIGPFMAFTLLSVFYATILISFSRAKQCILHRKLADLGLRIEYTPRFSALWLTGVSIVIYMTMIIILLYSISKL